MLCALCISPVWGQETWLDYLKERVDITLSFKSSNFNLEKTHNYLENSFSKVEKGDDPTTIFEFRNIQK